MPPVERIYFKPAKRTLQLSSDGETFHEIPEASAELARPDALPFDLFRDEDGTVFHEPWASETLRRVLLRRPEQPQPNTTYTTNDIRLTFRHATKEARYIGTVAPSIFHSNADFKGFIFNNVHRKP